MEKSENDSKVATSSVIVPARYHSRVLVSMSILGIVTGLALISDVFLQWSNATESARVGAIFVGPGLLAMGIGYGYIYLRRR